MPLVQLANGPLSATGPAAEVELDEIDLGYVLRRFKSLARLPLNGAYITQFRMLHIVCHI